MKYTTEEALTEIMHRSEKIRVRKERRSCLCFSIASGAMCATLVFVIAVLPKVEIGTCSETVYGSLLLTREAGGYVLAAVIAFAMGVTVTLLCLYLKKRKLLKGSDNGRKEGDP